MKLLAFYIIFYNVFSELLPEESFNVEQVVQCLRHSVNPQTQHLSLLLLSTTASTYPVSYTVPVLWEITAWAGNADIQCY